MQHHLIESKSIHLKPNISQFASYNADQLSNLHTTDLCLIIHDDTHFFILDKAVIHCITGIITKEGLIIQKFDTVAHWIHGGYDILNILLEYYSAIDVDPKIIPLYIGEIPDNIIITQLNKDSDSKV